MGKLHMPGLIKSLRIWRLERELARLSDTEQHPQNDDEELAMAMWGAGLFAMTLGGILILRVVMG